MKTEQEILIKLDELEDEYFKLLHNGDLTRGKQMKHKEWASALNWVLGENNGQNN